MAGTVTDRLPLRPQLFAAATARAISRGRPSMRIGLIAPPGVPVPPLAYGGTESVIDRLARGLVRAGPEVLPAAAANSSCPVPRVGGTEEADDTAPVCGDLTTELRHVIRSYAAMTDV